MCKICSKVISKLAHIKKYDDDMNFHIGELKRENLHHLRPEIHDFIHKQMHGHWDDCGEMFVSSGQTNMEFFGPNKVVAEALSYVPALLDERNAND